jgi:hypothetical protein
MAQSKNVSMNLPLTCCPSLLLRRTFEYYGRKIDGWRDLIPKWPRGRRYRYLIMHSIISQIAVGGKIGIWTAADDDFSEYAQWWVSFTGFVACSKI